MLVGKYGHNWRVLSNSAFFRSVKVYSNNGGIEDQHTAAQFRWLLGSKHKVLTFMEYRAVSGVFQTIDPHPLTARRVCTARLWCGGRTNSLGGGGGGGWLIVRKTPDTALYSIYVSTLCFSLSSTAKKMLPSYFFICYGQE
jgi:hypothetical protein